MPKEQFEVKLQDAVQALQTHITNWNKTIDHAINNWNNAKADPVAAIKSGDKLAELLVKAKHTNFIAVDELGECLTSEQIDFCKQRIKENK